MVGWVPVAIYGGLRNGKSIDAHKELELRAWSGSPCLLRSCPRRSERRNKLNQHVAVNPVDLKWGDVPPGLPAGAKLAVLEGDPMKKGPFTVRMQAPVGYRVPPHTHPAAEHITVISGPMNFGMGEKFDEAAGKQLETGGYISMPAGMAHYAWSTGESIIQIHGMGPFAIKYVNPADDPRDANK